MMLVTAFKSIYFSDYPDYVEKPRIKLVITQMQIADVPQTKRKTWLTRREVKVNEMNLGHIRAQIKNL